MIMKKRRQFRGKLLVPYLIAFKFLLLHHGIMQQKYHIYAWTITPQQQHKRISNTNKLLLTTNSKYYATGSDMTYHYTVLFAKRNKKQSKQDPDDLNRWYDAVEEDASPEEIFWEEMERQKSIAGGPTDNNNPNFNVPTSPNSDIDGGIGGGGIGGGGPTFPNNNNFNTPPPMNNPPPNPAAIAEQQRSAEATLSEYTLFMVPDNFLDEEIISLMEAKEKDSMEMSPEEQQAQIDEEFEKYNKGEFTKDEIDEDASKRMQENEPWDIWAEKMNPKDELDIPEGAREFLLPDDDDEEAAAQAQREEQELLERLSKIKTKSLRLEKARQSSKAKEFFAREPNSFEGYDQLWVSAVDNVCFQSLIGTFADYGIEFADNFGDWEDGCAEDGLFSIEDMAGFKARSVYNVTGLPCIASRTSFEIEPTPPNNLDRPVYTLGGVGGIPGPVVGGRNRMPSSSSPRITSGYKINDIGMNVDYLCEALRPLSEPTRVTRFHTCLCFYDGNMEILEYGMLDCDIHFANSMRTLIPVSQALVQMTETLKLTFGLEFQKFLKQRMDEAMGGPYGGARLKLRDRILKEGRVLPNDIIDVSKFMDSNVDVNLMDDCAQELSNMFAETKPTKILTVATTGLVIALPMAKYLQVPCVYARKERNVVMADAYQAGYSSKTVGKNRELLVSKNHIDPTDRILIIDDFLSSGASQEALLRIISDAGATAVGVGVLLEKVYESGRRSLSGFNVPVKSLCRVASVSGGVIQLIEEEGFDVNESRRY